jgi:hypothetical protein
MKKLSLLSILFCGLVAGSAYSMGPESQMFASTNNMDDDSAVPTISSSLTEYQKKKLELKKLKLALEIKQVNGAAFFAICPECGTFSNSLADPNARPANGQYLCSGKCGAEKRFHEYAYFNKLQRDADATIHRLKRLLNESE